MRISDWSSDVCSSDLTKGGEEITPHIHSPRKFNMFRRRAPTAAVRAGEIVMPYLYNAWYCAGWSADLGAAPTGIRMLDMDVVLYRRADGEPVAVSGICPHRRSEEHTSELQSLMRISYAVFCLKKKTQ